MTRRGLSALLVLTIAALLPAAPAHAAARPALSVAHSEVFFDGRTAWDDGDPLVVGHCDEPTNPGVSYCGNLQLSLTIAGFSAFGGLADCLDQTGDPYCVDGGAILGGSTVEARISYRCLADGARHKVRDRTVLLGLDSIGVDSTSINAYTRNDDDSATLTLRSDLITDSLRQQCPVGKAQEDGSTSPAGIQLLGARVDHFRLSYSGAGTYPDALWRSKGSYSSPTALGEQATLPVSFR